MECHETKRTYTHTHTHTHRSIHITLQWWRTKTLPQAQQHYSFSRVVTHKTTTHEHQNAIPLSADKSPPLDGDTAAAEEDDDGSARSLELFLSMSRSLSLRLSRSFSRLHQKTPNIKKPPAHLFKYTTQTTVRNLNRFVKCMHVYICVCVCVCKCVGA
jgi:hypothetical protein